MSIRYAISINLQVKTATERDMPCLTAKPAQTGTMIAFTDQCRCWVGQIDKADRGCLVASRLPGPSLIWPRFTLSEARQEPNDRVAPVADLQRR